MSLSSGSNAREQAGAQTSHPYETVGLTTASNRRLIMGNDLLHMSALCLALKRAAAPLPFCASFAKAGKMLPDSWKTMPRYLKEADWGNTCCPTCHVPEAVPLKVRMAARQWQTALIGLMRL